MVDSSSWLYLLAVVGGPLILGIWLARGMWQTDRRRQDDPAGVARTEQATHDLYEAEERRGDVPLAEATSTDIEEARRREDVARRRSMGRNL